MSESLRVAILGLGLVGEVHLRAYDDLPGLSVVAAAEPNRRRADAVVNGRAIRIYDDHQALLSQERIDIACVCTPVATHCTVVKACTAAGAHVLCEKPLALSSEEGRSMIAAADQAGVLLGYGASYRYLGAVRKAVDMVRCGNVGTLLLMRESVVGGSGPAGRHVMGPSHYPLGGMGGSGLGLVDHGVHLVDLFQLIAGSPPSRVCGRGNRSGEPFLPEYLTMEFPCGAIGTLLYEEGTYPTALPGEGIFSAGEGWSSDGAGSPGEWLPQPGWIEIYGDAGSLRIYHYANRLFFTDTNGSREVLMSPDGAAPWHFARQLEAFASAVRLGQLAPVSAAAGVAALDILERLYVVGD